MRIAISDAETPRVCRLHARARRALEACARRPEERAPSAADVLPESCGVLIGTRAGPELCVLEARRTPNLDPRPGRFLVDPGAIAQHDRAACERGLELVGFFHTHPRGRATPSRADRDGAWDGHVVVVATSARIGAHWPVASGFASLAVEHLAEDHA
ncbi:MAG: Mov34/MPN/PAD-1 family protein [Planctomycetes bacterium]|nr:Mov34/MPN/PAD-1 family protein [Planctomycetota bacterium]